MSQTSSRTYTMDSRGVITTTDITVVSDDTGAEIARGKPHIVPYMPGSDVSTFDDVVLVAMAGAAWTPDIVSAYKAFVQSETAAIKP